MQECSEYTSLEETNIGNQSQDQKKAERLIALLLAHVKNKGISNIALAGNDNQTDRYDFQTSCVRKDFGLVPVNLLK